MVAGGKRPDETLKDAEAAIDAWGEYEDAHAIEPPPVPGMNEILSKFSDMADRIGSPHQRTQDDLADLVTEMANALEESVCVLENKGRKTKSNKMLISRICALVTRADSAQNSTAQSPATDLSSPANGGSPQ